MRLDREGQEFALRRPPQHPGHSRIQKPDYCLEHTVRRKGVTLVDAQDAVPGDAQHHSPIVMRNYVPNILKPEQAQPFPE